MSCGAISGAWTVCLACTWAGFRFATLRNALRPFAQHDGQLTQDSRRGNITHKNTKEKKKKKQKRKKNKMEKEKGKEGKKKKKKRKKRKRRKQKTSQKTVSVASDECSVSSGSDVATSAGTSSPSSQSSVTPPLLKRPVKRVTPGSATTAAKKARDRGGGSE